MYFNAILAIPALSQSGQAQLSADMQYLCSILDRLGRESMHGRDGQIGREMQMVVTSMRMRVIHPLACM